MDVINHPNYSDSCSFSHHLDTQPEMVLGAADWLVANINMTGFYRVNYDEDNWERLIAKLSSNHQVQHLQHLCFVSVINV